MLCNVCAKNDATIHLTEILNNEMIEIHLCESCAEQKGTDFKTQFNFNQLLASISGLTAEAKAPRFDRVVCDFCGMLSEEFAQTGRLGCANCYDVFEKLLTPLLKRVQRQLLHVGKIPTKSPSKIKENHMLRELYSELQKSVQSEAYEEAAKLRDKIKDLEEKLKKENSKDAKEVKKSKF